MSSGEPTWYTYTITAGNSWGGDNMAGVGGAGSSGSGLWIGDGATWGGGGGGAYIHPYRDDNGIDLEELKRQYDFSKLGIPFKSQVEITKEKLEKIRDVMSKFVVVVEIEGVPTAVVPGDKISDLYNAIKDIVEK